MATDAEILAIAKQEHQLVDEWGCGARSRIMPHRHSSHRWEDKSMKCTLEAGHDGLHRDAICCWHFESFSEVDHFEPIDRRACTCGQRWESCSLVQAIYDLKED